jgi:cytochrome c5
MSNNRILAAVSQPRFLVLPVVALLAVVLAGCSEQAPVHPERSARLIQPVGQVALDVDKPADEAPAEQASAPSGPPDGEAVYKKACAACHVAGVAGAPKEKDEAGWADRIAKGLDENVAAVISGKGAMPPRGGVPSLSDDEIRHAVVYLMNTAGAGFSAD